MTSDFSQQSAKIYEFPAGGRKSVAPRRDEANRSSEPRVWRISAAVFGSAWYHEAAIQEAERTGDR